MKSGWVTKKLGEVCELINGKNQSEVSDPNVGLILAGKAACREGRELRGHGVR